MESALYFEVHLLEHGFAVERVHTPAEEAEVHVEVRTPGSVVGASFFVVALEVGGLGGYLFSLESCHQSSLFLRDFGRKRVMLLPALTRERRLAGGSLLIWVYQP